ncbi:MAG: acetylglutamate kinase [Candidatus Omnitrophica bacterium CG11_big_fil_rev_8_21_14_0_20_45_26]|uniref:Acetylglutamate kinase n=1 Tax=Candidatus Abzuiibacterium crystallinum TaxID=1974748 RepID=A0A2H0LT02_9BACT|nr:MAG: acetylglutamate kinase [Candidatus Omnitrophica bacterium CG11_big_fil_rev_8_21_14_0_20_45_26]PIW63382.1 MAG: acetylglutamate kinase [Candidatus Omnitrophica bacterium CG12_big_fil_rev_8_21_14_0_65_45_16]
MKQLVEKASILIEALPYIKRFRGKEIVIKYGGAVMTDPEDLLNFLQDLVFMNYVGIKPILVHGGGPSITANLKKSGLQSKFVNGLRVTDEKTMEVVIDTLADLNKSLVHDLNRLGARAIGFSGHDAEIFHVEKHKASGDVGFVGDVVSVNFAPIREMTDLNIIPVIYAVGIDDDFKTYNVNADEAASKLAVAMQVQKIMILTNVDGILRDAQDPQSLISSIQTDEVQDLIDRKIIQGGMIPKIKAGIEALQGGVKKAHIINGNITHSLLLEVFTDRGIGTEIILPS